LSESQSQSQSQSHKDVIIIFQSKEIL